MMDDMPPDPLLPQGLGEAMKAMYELFAAAKQAGFSDEQSMQLVVAMLQSMMNKGMETEKP
jgi:hypothetical protein